MIELVKAALAVLVALASAASCWAWLEPAPTVAAWLARFAAPVAGLAGAAVFLRIHFHRPRVTDYLRQIFDDYYDRGGLCFNIDAHVETGVCVFDVFFQNRYDAPCTGRVALRPAKGLFGWRKADWITCDIRCEGGAFGVARAPVGLPAGIQGKNQTFEVGAAVTYLEGRGREIRSGRGKKIAQNAEFRDAQLKKSATTTAAAATQVVYVPRPVHLKLDLPAGVAEQLPFGKKPEVKILWRMGDPPFEFAG